MRKCRARIKISRSVSVILNRKRAVIRERILQTRQYMGNVSNVEYPVISMIVPVYNVEKYLPCCLESLEKQTYPNLEIVLVDDGSPDNCGKICDDFAQKGQNVKVIHQENQGLSAARNNGLNESTGRYILFVDSDDFITDNCVSYLYEILKRDDADIAIAESRNYWNNVPAGIPCEFDGYECMDPEKALIRMCYGRGFGLPAWNKLYRREIVSKFPYPIGKLYEDIATTYKMIGDAEKIAFAKGVTYFYRMREGSIVHQKLDPQQLYGLTAGEELLEYVRQRYPAAEDAAEFRCLARICDFVNRSFDDKDTFRMLREESKKYLKTVLRDQYATNGVKVRGIAILGGFTWSKIVFALILKAKMRKLKKEKWIV